MTIPASMPVKASYIGDGVTVNFPIPFVYFENTDGTKQIKVVLADADGENEIIQYENSNFTITDAGNVNGTLNMKIAPETGKKLSIVYNIPIEQLISYKEFGRLPSESIENALDKLTAILKQHQEIIDRCVKVTISGNQTPQELLDEVYAKLDSATDIASQAISAANEATAAADNATAAVESAEETLAEVTTYVDSSKSDIANLVSNAENSIDETISQATTEVKAAAIEVAQETLSNEVVPYVNQSAQYASAAKASETAAKSSQTAAAANAEEARKYAQGTIQELSSGSSKYWAEEAKEYAGILNIDSIRTNCLTQTPNNIIYEFTDNIFKIKANSKVYIPNGNSNFEEIILDKDYIPALLTASNGKYVVFYRKDKQMFSNMSLSQCYSGDGSDIPSASCMYYDITKNELRYFSSAGVASELFSFPLAILNVENNQVVSVAEVFQWCGYIGRTLFRYKVKGKVSDGRDSDGGIINRNIEINRVNITTFGKSTNIRNRFLTCDSSGNMSESSELIISSKQPQNKDKSGALWYNPISNILYRFGSTGLVPWYHLILGNFTVESGKIVELILKTVFYAPDINSILYGNNNYYGKNSFNDNKITVKSTTIDWAETSNTVQTFPSVSFVDKNDKEVASIYPNISSSDNRFISIIIKNKDFSGWFYNFYPNLVNVPTPSNAANNEAVNAAWVRNMFPLKDNFKVVSTLPANPDANTFYFIPEEE